MRAASVALLLLALNGLALGRDAQSTVCLEEQAMKCHHLAYCDGKNGCSCPQGFWGDGEGSQGCQKHAASIQLALVIPMAQVTNSKLAPAALAPIKNDIKRIFGSPPNFDSTFHHSVTETLTGNRGGLLLVMNVLYENALAAKSALAALDFRVNPENLQLEYFDRTAGREMTAIVNNIPVRVSGDQAIGSAETLPIAQLWEQETITNVKTTIVFAGLAANVAPSPPAPKDPSLKPKDPRKIRLPLPLHTE